MINEFERLCRSRKSVRKFSSNLIEEDKIIQIVNIINSAPSAGNLQAYEVVVVKSKEIIRELYEAALHQSFIEEAAIVLVFIAKPQESSQVYGARGEGLYCIQDASIACTYAMLACEALQLATTWVGAFNEEKVKDIIRCKKEDIPVALLPIGYSLSNNISLVGRKDLSELTREI